LNLFEKALSSLREGKDQEVRELWVGNMAEIAWKASCLKSAIRGRGRPGGIHPGRVGISS